MKQTNHDNSVVFGNKENKIEEWKEIVVNTHKVSADGEQDSKCRNQ